ncbi:MAG: peptide ABC transporter substrate-binding protein [Spirochaetes bacterium]|nr:peptide ABC transporter substrate-binding protein [Spirochaetota bacterium]
MKKWLGLFCCLLMVLLVACGGGGDQKGAHLIIGNGAEPQSMDPATITGVPEHRIYMAVFEGLVEYHPETCQPVPGVAESWSISDDGTVYTFKIRKNAIWSDGTDITAQTVVDSWLRFLDPATAAQYAWMMTMVVKGASEYNSGKAGPEAVAIRALDEDTFQMELVGPTPYALGMLSHYAFAVHPLHVIAKHGEEWTLPENIVSNGPFVLKEWKPQETMIVEKNDKYWDKDEVKLQSIEFLPIDDNNTALNMYLNKEIDWLTDYPSDRLEEVRKEPGYHSAPQLSSYYYQFNCVRPPFDDPRVRKAMAMAIDRKELVDKVTLQGEIPAFAMTPPMPGYTPAKGNPEDIEMAKRYLADAGYPDGEGFPEFTLIYNTSENHKKVAQYIQQKWSEILGINVVLENQEWKTYLDNKRNGQFDVARAGWVGDYLDPNTFLELFISTSAQNGGKYNNPKFDELIHKAARMKGGSERLQVLMDAEEIFITEDQAILPMYYYVSTNIIDTAKWGGWYENTLDIHPWKSIYMK